MKTSRLLCLFFALVFAISLISVSVYAEDTGQDDKINVLLNDEKVLFDQPPVMVSDRVLVPIRAIFEKLNYKVSWEEETQTATSTKGDSKIIVQIDNPVIKYTKNNQEYEYICDVAPVTMSDRTMVPVRAIAECAGCEVTWSEVRNTVYLFSRFSDEKYVPDGSVVATVNDVEITDKDLNYFIYQQVSYFYDKSAALINNPFMFNWDKATFNDIVAKDYIINKALEDVAKTIIYIDIGLWTFHRTSTECEFKKSSRGRHQDQHPANREP